ncbi:MAG: hypothetical protein QOJ01_315 [Solirubrobacterales bacterium]|nr:hypothetical protein [Solirubrobacterales bacterium]
MPVLALSNGDVILIIVFVAIPIGLLSFALGAKGAFDEIGKGPFAMDHDPVASESTGPLPTTPAAREAEIRQMLEAKAYRQQARGAAPLDVDAELQRLLEAPAATTIHDAALRAEVRDLVVARNHRRVRQGKDPLDVETEIERQLRDLEGLGQ